MSFECVDISIGGWCFRAPLNTRLEFMFKQILQDTWFLQFLNEVTEAEVLMHEIVAVF